MRMMAAALIAGLGILPQYGTAAPAAKTDGASCGRISSANVNGVIMAYRICGPAKGPTMILLPGIGMQLIEWPPELIANLQKEGFRVLALDLRDSGGSTHFSDSGQPDWAAFFTALGSGKAPELAYLATDMSADVLALMDWLKIERADFLGLSGGATIGELIAIAEPERVRSLALIAANSGNPAVKIPADPERFAGQAQPRVNEQRDEMIARRADTARRLAGQDTVFDAAATEALMKRAVARDDEPFGVQRQGIALLALGDLRSRLKAIQSPTLVIHGADDPLLSAALGKEVADAIPAAQYLLLDGMGHEVATNRVPEIVEAVVANAARGN